MSEIVAVEATVTGNDEKVGFRAMVMKQAIEFNLAGAAVNEPGDVVRFTLQGKKKRIDTALATIREGTKRSSDIEVKTASVVVDPALEAFTIIGWTSSSRNITDKYDLVFKLRADGSSISPADAKTVWAKILEKTLSPADRKKLRPED